MTQSTLRNILMLIAFVLLLTGAILKITEHSEAFYLLIVSILLYIFARFFMKRGPVK